MHCGDTIPPRRTKPVAKSLEPQWGADDGWFEFEGVQRAAAIRLEFFDRDVIGKDEPMGQIELPVAGSLVDGCVYR